jgi:hypothetical protein
MKLRGEETRRPKVETRKKAEARNPKAPAGEWQERFGYES